MGPMRILVVSPYFPPRNAIGALRVHSFARSWAAAGDDVTVLTTAKRPHQREHEMPSEGFEVVEVDYPVRPMLERLRRSVDSLAAGSRADAAFDEVLAETIEGLRRGESLDLVALKVKARLTRAYPSLLIMPATSMLWTSEFQPPLSTKWIAASC